MSGEWIDCNWTQVVNPGSVPKPAPFQRVEVQFMEGYMVDKAGNELRHNNVQKGQTVMIQMRVPAEACSVHRADEVLTTAFMAFIPDGNPEKFHIFGEGGIIAAYRVLDW